MDVLDERLHDLAEHLGVQTPEPSPVLRERARRLRRSRRLTRVLAAALAVVSAVGVIAFVARDRSSTSRIETPATTPTTTTTTATQLGVDDGHGSVTFHDVDADATRVITLPGKATGDYPYQLVRVGDWFVYPGNGIESIRTDISGGPVALGNATTFVPSAREGWVWLVTFPGDGQSAETVQEVQVDGTARSPAAQLPAGMVAQIGVTGGLLIGNGTTVVKWDQSTSEVGPELFNGSAGFIDAHDDTVAWGLECGRTSTCAALRVLDLATGTQREFDAPAGTSGWIPTSGEGSHDALTSSSDYLAVRVGGEVPSGDNHPATSTLSVIDLRSGEVHEVPRSTNDNAFSRTAWSPDNRTLFFDTADHTIGAYQPDTRTSSAHSGECCGVALVTMPATPGQTTTTSATPTTTPTTSTAPRPSSGSLNDAHALVIDASGSIVFSKPDSHQVMRRTPDGELQVVAGTGVAGESGDGGPATIAQLERPVGLALSPEGTLYIADSDANRVRAVASDGTITTVVGNGDRAQQGGEGDASQVVVPQPLAVAVSSTGDLYLACSDGVRRVHDGIVTKVIPAGPGSIDINGQPTNLEPDAIAVDTNGNLFIANFSPKMLYEFAPDGALLKSWKVYVSSAGLALDTNGNVVIADYGFALTRITPDGQLQTIHRFAKDEISGVAGAFRPVGAAPASDGSVYIVDDGRSGGSNGGLIQVKIDGSITLLDR